MKRKPQIALGKMPLIDWEILGPTEPDIGGLIYSLACVGSLDRKGIDLATAWVPGDNYVREVKEAYKKYHDLCRRIAAEDRILSLVMDLADVYERFKSGQISKLESDKLIDGLRAKYVLTLLISSESAQKLKVTKSSFRNVEIKGPKDLAVNRVSKIFGLSPKTLYNIQKSFKPVEIPDLNRKEFAELLLVHCCGVHKDDEDLKRLIGKMKPY